MEVINVIKNMLSPKNTAPTALTITYDGNVNFSDDAETLEKIKNGEADENITAQYIALQMLVEQGNANPLPDGFELSAETVVNLDRETQQLLELPPLWEGKIKAEMKNTTYSDDFVVYLDVEKTDYGYTGVYELDFPRICIESDWYLLSSAQFMVFSAIEKHKISARREYDNLLLLKQLQQAQSAGCDIQLAHFDKFDLTTPDSVTIVAERDEAGNLLLTPNMGQQASPDSIKKVLGQLSDDATQSLRVGNEIILFNEEKLAAVKEIVKNRKIPAKEVKQFLANPTAYFDASLIDLDLGFSARVHGVTEFKHAYFGETDSRENNWFEAAYTQTLIHPITAIVKEVEDQETFERLQQTLQDAQNTGATQITFNDKNYDIEDKATVEQVLETLEQKLQGHSEPQEPEAEPSSDEDEDEDEKITLVVDIDLNDEDVETPSVHLQQYIDDILFRGQLDWKNYKRQPYPHQETGVRWILGLLNANQNINQDINQDTHQTTEQNGGLLADDMGLGKTFMALAAVEKYYQQLNTEQKTCKPTLVIAPLSLLENWKDEVDETFKQSPFDDAVILQTNADLKRFRCRQGEIPEDMPSGIKYALKVGDSFLTERLDMPNRLVLATYQTLRDYQFSLCLVDWGMVVFDEAQNIKNPNALQTRAAKGLKADFKLLATGTPVENSLADFWCLMDTARPGFLNSYQDFREQYITPINRAASDEEDRVRGLVGRKLREKVGALMLRRVKEDNLKGLPEKHLYVGMENTQWQYLPSIASTMQGGQQTIYDAVLQQQNTSDENHVLASLHSLRDCSLHPSLIDGGKLHATKDSPFLSVCQQSGKLNSLLALLRDIQSKGEKCIIFAVNKRLQAFLSQHLGKHFGLGLLAVINGDAKAVAKNKNTPTRKSMIKKFEDKEGFNLIIMSPIAAGVGLTVVGANHVVHLERHWNPAKEAQATDRVYRIGQTKPVHIYVPILSHPEISSFDEKLHQLLTQKLLLKDAIVTTTQVLPTDALPAVDDFDAPMTIDMLAQIPWQHFEALIAVLFDKYLQSGNTQLTATNDFGADVVINSKGVLALIQCKHTKSKSYDGYKAIQEVSAAKIRYEKQLNKPVKKLLFVTNANKLSARTHEIAKEYQVILFDLQKITQLLNQHSVSYKDILQKLEQPRLKI